MSGGVSAQCSWRKEIGAKNTVSSGGPGEEVIITTEKPLRVPTALRRRPGARFRRWRPEQDLNLRPTA